MKYKRVLLKLSGEVMAGSDKTGVNKDVLNELANTIKEISSMGVEVGIVVGGGNFWRGRNGQDIERDTADYMGMLATVMNALALGDTLDSRGVPNKVLTAVEISGIGELYNHKKALKYLNEGNVVIFGAGTGHPYFTTDTAAVLRAIEIKADIILLGKNIDGVYTDDPKLNKEAKKYDKITYLDVLNQDLKVMDATATALCKDNNMPLLVFGISDSKNIVRAVKGEKIGTIVEN